MALPRPEHVGILAMEAYFPTRCVQQTALEAADGCSGKYTSGLGQTALAFVDDREDVGSIMLSALSQLLEKYQIDPKDVGRLEVGTETLVDKSKSIKTTLLQLLGLNANVEGVTSVNACYGGTASLLNSVAWVQSEDWDGRYAVVVCGDIAVYEVPEGAVCGSARATQGCGAVAMLIGANAPLVLEPGLRATHAMDVYDFYKPNHSEFAVVDGAVSQNCYLRSVDACYRGYKARAAAKGEATVTVASFDYMCFHSPYHKLVQKGFSRLAYVDALDVQQQLPTPAAAADGAPAVAVAIPEELLALDYEKSLEDKKLDAVLRQASSSAFAEKMSHSSYASKEVGNCYTGAVFVNLLSLICGAGQEALLGKRIGVFSYGSGSVATFYSLRCRQPSPAEEGKSSPSSSSAFTLARIQETVGLRARLEQTRKTVTAEEFTQAMDYRAEHYGKPGYQPNGPIANVAPGAFYLESVNELHHRAYKRMPAN